MAGIRAGRCLLAGVAAAIVLGASETVFYRLYWRELEAALSTRSLALDLFSVRGLLVSTLATYLTGQAIAFFYAAASPRLGAGARGALIVAAGVWLGGYVVALCAYYVVHLFAGRLLLTWSIIGLVEMLLAGLAAAAIYEGRYGRAPNDFRP